MATEYLAPDARQGMSEIERMNWEQEEEAIAAFNPAPLSVDQIAALPGKGRHFVYALHAVIPGVCPIRGECAAVYVGMTSNLRQRMTAHSKRWWWTMCSQDLVEFIEQPTRAAASSYEMGAIRDGDPDLNVVLGVGRKQRVTP